jgi:hypothetical protein
MKFSLALTLAFAASAAAAVPSLTPDNYDELTDGKTVFIKFFAPWVSFKSRTGIAFLAPPSLVTVTSSNSYGA